MFIHSALHEWHSANAAAAHCCLCLIRTSNQLLILRKTWAFSVLSWTFNKWCVFAYSIKPALMSFHTDRWQIFKRCRTCLEVRICEQSLSLWYLCTLEEPEAEVNHGEFRAFAAGTLLVALPLIVRLGLWDHILLNPRWVFTKWLMSFCNILYFVYPHHHVGGGVHLFKVFQWLHRRVQAPAMQAVKQWVSKHWWRLQNPHKGKHFTSVSRASSPVASDKISPGKQVRLISRGHSGWRRTGRCQSHDS